MLPLKELLIVCALISSPSLIQQTPDLYCSLVFVDARGKVLPEVTDSRRSSTYFADDCPISDESIEWYKHSFVHNSRLVASQTQQDMTSEQPENSKVLTDEFPLVENDFGSLLVPTL